MAPVMEKLANVKAVLMLNWPKLSLKLLRRKHLTGGSLARSSLPATFISVLVWANDALVLWLLVQLRAPTPITSPLAITKYLRSGTPLGLPLYLTESA